MCGVACAGGSSWGRHHLVAALRSGLASRRPRLWPALHKRKRKMRTANKLGCREGPDPETVSIGGAGRRVIGGPARVRSLVINHSNNNSKNNNNNHPRN